MRLCDQQAKSGDSTHGRSEFTLEQCLYIANSYGMGSIIADIDRQREFWRDGEHVVSAILDYLCHDGIDGFMRAYNFEVRTAAEFRELMKHKKSIF